MNEVNDDNFQEVVMKSSRKVLVDFWASWCGPCKAMEPILKQIESEMPDVLVVKLNADDNQATANRFSVKGLPTFLIIKDGKIVNRITGALSKDKLISILG